MKLNHQESAAMESSHTIGMLMLFEAQYERVFLIPTQPLLWAFVGSRYRTCTKAIQLCRSLLNLCTRVVAKHAQHQPQDSPLQWPLCSNESLSACIPCLRALSLPVWG